MDSENRKRDKEEQRRRVLAAEEWKREHFRKFISALNACTDVQTLRALAHRLGYKEGT